ncbi:patatin-like phospholipase family protein [Xanthobacteraceae bacterium Astr-EGSB]|uniref:patatin-like phospholipase family protein n=1 Tax=Astrobacterium formosum TaxID=3069710 RepID=UPI0027AFE46C|nr:patatin-like phospholipase family protein [Xanthobacteraceae bacterium Astr-EGSB]
MSDEPVTRIPSDQGAAPPEDGIALCLSGGGYRAMVFHIGALWRLYETGLLGTIKRISTVSGGSITGGMLGLAWRKLSFDPARLKDDFVPHVVMPLRRLAGETIDADAIIIGSILPGRISDRVAGAYDAHLFNGATLQDLPDAPRFVINATNVQSGVLWRFSKPYMRDYRVGEVKRPTVPLAQAVAASSAFPPVLSPFELRLDPASFTPGSGKDLQREPFTTKVMLTDGGVYDNLGLETAWKRYKTILVSDAGGQMAAEEEPKSDWARHSYRVLNLVDNQVRSLRKRQAIDAFKSKVRSGAYWGIRTNIADYELASALVCPFDRTMALAETPTRLKRMDARLQERLINWGYAVCDAALRRHVEASLGPKPQFPYPASPI